NTDFSSNERELLLSNKTKFKVISREKHKMLLEVYNGNGD
ncbi:hypothetical protein CP10881SC42_1016, partial [Chlamydia avium]